MQVGWGRGSGQLCNQFLYECVCVSVLVRACVRERERVRARQTKEGLRGSQRATFVPLQEIGSMKTKKAISQLVLSLSLYIFNEGLCLAHSPSCFLKRMTFFTHHRIHTAGTLHL